MLLRTARGGEFQVQLGTKGLIVLVVFAPEHDLARVRAMLERIFIAWFRHALIRTCDFSATHQGCKVTKGQISVSCVLLWRKRSTCAIAALVVAEIDLLWRILP